MVKITKFPVIVLCFCLLFLFFQKAYSDTDQIINNQEETPKSNLQDHADSLVIKAVEYLYTYHDTSSAIKVLIESAQKENHLAEYLLGLLCPLYYSIDEGFPIAIYWLTKSAERGYAVSQYTLGDIYSTNTPFLDLTKSVYWIRKSAEQGNADAQYKLAEGYISGELFEKDYYKAKFWLEKSAEQGHADAQLFLYALLGSGYISE